MSVRKKKVVLIEDNPEVRQAFKLIINSSSKFVVVGDFDDCETALKKARKLHAEIVLMDIELPGIGGIEGTQLIKSLDPRIEVIIVSVHDDSEFVYEALRKGASGYISKSSNYSELLNGLEEITRGGAPMSSKIARMIVTDFHINLDNPLGKKETQVLKFLSEGKTYTQIAEELAISKETVKSHLRHIYKKLGVNRKSEAIEKGTMDKLI